MQTVDLDQNTKDWLKARKNFIGGSDVSTIMCVSPWRTPLQLWEEKLGICTPDHAAKAYIFERGHRYELIARQAYELKVGFDVPAQVVQHAQIPYCRVSLDGLNLDQKEVIEIKYMGVADWTLLKHKDIVPPHYIPQVQYQLLATGFDSLTFIGINESKKLAITQVAPDLDYMRKMISWCNYFWSMVKEKKPPKHIPKDFKMLMRKAGVKHCNRIFKIDQTIGKLLDERLKLQDEVLKLARSTRMAFQGKILIRTCDFDHDDLGLISELKEVDLSVMARSIKDDLKLVIIKNNLKIKGGLCVKRKKRTKSKKKKSKTRSKGKSKTCQQDNQDRRSENNKNSDQ